jgi:hypothetical protein
MKTKIKYLLVLVLASFVFVGCATSHCGKMAQWEYRTETFSLNVGLNTDLDSGKLDKAATNGWEFVSATPTENRQVLVIFKRLKQ